MKLRYVGRFQYTGSLCPSSKSLARAMFKAASAYIDQHDEVIFAGIGSGVIAELFSVIDKRVVFVDIDTEFCARFERRVGPGQEVVCTDFRDYLRQSRGPAGKRLIVSCLPMRGAFRSEALRDALLDQVAQGATVVFYSYLPRATWASGGIRFAGRDIRVAKRATVLRNLPPAFVYSLSAGPDHPDSTRIRAGA